MGGPLHRLPARSSIESAGDEPADDGLVGPRRDPGGRRAAPRRRHPDPARRRSGRPSDRRFLKAESLQPIGAFKLRGAYDAIASLSPDGPCPRRHHLLVGQPRPGRRPGRAAARRAVRSSSCRRTRRRSSATGSRRTGPRSSIVGTVQRRAAARSPSGSPRSAGSRSSRRTTTTGSSPARARSGSRSSRTCRTSPPSWCPIGGGGLASGVAAAVKALRPGARVIGVEPELAADAAGVAAARARSSAGRPRTSSRTIADGTRTQSLGERTFAHLRAYLDGIVTVTEAEIVAGVRLAAERSRLVVEPSGALSIAAMAFHAAELGLAAGDGPVRRRRQRRQRGPGGLSRVPRGAAALGTTLVGRADDGTPRRGAVYEGQHPAPSGGVTNTEAAPCVVDPSPSPSPWLPA